MNISFNKKELSAIIAIPTIFIMGILHGESSNAILIGSVVGWLTCLFCLWLDEKIPDSTIDKLYDNK